jgi:hypothetical protein
MFQNLGRCLRDGSTLKTRCSKCGHEHVWAGQLALARFGPDAAPYDIRRRLRCTACGTRGLVQVWI